MASELETLKEAFDSRNWREALDALFEATGLIVAVMDRHACSLVYSTAHCTYCELATPLYASTPSACFDDPPHISEASLTRTVCRAGLPCYIAPVSIEGGVDFTVVVGGFVSSTRERKRLFEKLLAKGVPEAQARVAVRDVPVLPKRQVEALVRLARLSATSIARGMTNRQRTALRERELETIADAGCEFAERRGMGQDLLDAVLTRAMAIVDADGGSLMLLRPGTDLLEVVSPVGEAVSNARGEIVRLGEGIAGRVAQTGRSVLITGEHDKILEHSTHPGRGISKSVSVPLKREGRLIGVLNLNITDSDRTLSGDDLSLVERYARLAAVAIDNARVHGATERAMFELMHLGELSKTLSGETDLEEIVRTGSSVLEKAFDFEVGGIVLTGWGYDQALAVVRGEVTEADVEAALGEAAGRDLAASPFESVRYITHLGSIETGGEPSPDWSVQSIALMVRDNVVGYAFIGSRGEGAFDRADHRLLEGLADHVSIALERAVSLQKMRDDLSRSIAALSVSMDRAERANMGHSERVTDYAMLIGEQIGLEIEQIEHLRFAGLLHDIGKTGISEEILLKPSRLTDEEMEEVRRHAEIGAEIVEQTEFLKALTPIIMHHHERWDGNGYPMRLAGKDIPILARILAIADAYDAMTSNSPYRTRLSYSQAREELLAGAGSQFDPGLVEAFLEAMDRRALAGTSGLFAGHQRFEGPQLPA